MSYCIFFNLLWHCKTKTSFRFTENVHQSAYHCKRLGINPSIANIAFETCTEWICFPIMGRFVVFRFVSQISCREILQCRHKMGPGCMDKLIRWSSRCCATNTIHPTILAELRWDLWALISSQLISGVFIFAAHWLMTTLDRETKMNSNMTFLTGVTSSEIRYKSDPRTHTTVRQTSFEKTMILFVHTSVKIKKQSHLSHLWGKEIRLLMRT